jgi:hypothetical protein
MAAPSIDEAFESPRLLLSSAREQLDRLNPVAQSFFASTPYRFAVDRDSDPAQSVHYVEIIRPPPPELRLLTYRVVNDLRNALDQAVYAASAALGRTKLDHVVFPFRQNPRDLDHALSKGQCRDVPVELHDLIRSFEPYPRGNGYPGGDNNLRAFGNVSNPNKHSVALRVGINATELIIHSLGGGAYSIPVNPWNSSKNKMTLFVAPKGSNPQCDIDVPLFIAFDKSILDGVPTIPFFAEILTKVASIIERLEAETRKIIAARV